jgi:hypothetical protein
MHLEQAPLSIALRCIAAPTGRLASGLTLTTCGLFKTGRSGYAFPDAVLHSDIRGPKIQRRAAVVEHYLERVVPSPETALKLERHRRNWLR